MSVSWEQQLAEAPVPPPPADLQHRVHRRLNGVLLVSQIVELALVVWPAVVLAAAPAVIDLLAQTLGRSRKSK